MSNFCISIAKTVFLCFLAFSGAAQAVEFYSYQNTKFDSKKPTTLFVIGSDVKELGANPVLTAVSRAIEYKRYFPDRQFIVIDQTQEDVYDKAEAKYKVSNKSFLANSTTLFEKGFIKIQVGHLDKTGNIDQKPKNDWSTYYLSVENLITIINYFEAGSIESLEIVSHGNPFYGPKFQGNQFQSSFINYYSQLKLLKPKFSLTAYVLLYGCNTGWLVAPEMARQIGLPVMGALTGAQFYTRAESSFLFQKNDKLQASDLCNHASCVKMIPNNFTYKGGEGHESNFSGGGLGFFKYFCDLKDESGLVTKRDLTRKCYMSMALSMAGQPSSYNKDIFNSRLNFSKTVAESICGSTEQKNLCMTQLLNSSRENPLNYSPFGDITLTCDFNSCNAEIDCSKRSPVNPNYKICEFLKPDPETLNNPNYTYWYEYQAYMTGYDYLQLDHSK